MNISIFTIGTQGDVRPFVAFARHLQNSGHRVTIATGAQHKELIENEHIRHLPIESDFLQLQIRQQAIIDTGNQWAIARRFTEMLREWVPMWVTQGLAAADGADLIIGSGSGTVLAASIAEKKKLPFLQAQFMPLTPSRYVPAPWPEHRINLPGALNIAMSKLIRLIIWRYLAGSNNALRSELNLAPYSWFGPWHGIDEFSRPRILYAFSRHLMPPPPDWPDERIRAVGFWFLDCRPDYVPPPELDAFLASGPPPVYIGFGSMRSGRAKELTSIAIDAARNANRRIVLATGWGGLDTSALNRSDDFMVVKDVPHDWLFPRMSLAIHHGGAGTVGAAARAGLPQLVIPFGADQFFWAWRLRELGVSPMRLDRGRVTSSELAEAIHRASDDSVARAAQRIGALIREENAIEGAADTLKSWGIIS